MTALLSVVDTPDPLAEIFCRLGIMTTTWSHRPVFTVGEGDDLKQHMPGGHTKNLFLKDKKDVLWLVSALDDDVIDLKKLPEKTGSARLSFGSAERLLDALGVIPGSVTPLALVNDRDRKVRPVLSAGLFRHERVNFHPLKNDKTTNLSPQDLLLFMKDQGYDPLIVDFAV